MNPSADLLSALGRATEGVIAVAVPAENAAPDAWRELRDALAKECCGQYDTQTRNSQCICWFFQAHDRDKAIAVLRAEVQRLGIAAEMVLAEPIGTRFEWRVSATERSETRPAGGKRKTRRAAPDLIDAETRAKEQKLGIL